MLNAIASGIIAAVKCPNGYNADYHPPPLPRGDSPDYIFTIEEKFINCSVAANITVLPIHERIQLLKQRNRFAETTE
jgi:hypothetical protein